MQLLDEHRMIVQVSDSFVTIVVLNGDGNLCTGPDTAESQQFLDEL
jgi:hypothetical protein